MSRKHRKQYFSSANRKHGANSSASAGLTRAQAMNAAIISEMSGQGGQQDRSIGDRPALSQWANPFLYGGNMLFAARYAWILYHADWMAQKIIDIPVFDMFREAWDWKYRDGDTEVDEELENECKRLKFIPMLMNGKQIERLVGGAVAIRVTREMSDGGDTRDPIDPEQIDKGDIICYNVLPSIMITKVEWQFDPSKPDYGRPLHYHIRDKIYHRSRLVVFDGQPISPYPQQDFATYSANWNGFGISKLSPIWDVIMRANQYQQGAAHMTNMASVWFLLYKGLKDLKMTRQGQKAIDEARHLVETMSMYKGVILDGDDAGGADVKTVGAQFGSVPELVMSGIQIVAAAADIHATRFMSTTLGGLSNNDRSGLENYYDIIAARQRLEVDPILNSEKRYLLNSALGTGVVDPADISHEWVSLWNLSDTEKAQVRTMDINNSINIANSLNAPDDWVWGDMKQRGAVDSIPNISAIERDKILQEMKEFGGGEREEENNAPGGNEKQTPSAPTEVRMPSVGGAMRKPRMPRMPGI